MIMSTSAQAALGSSAEPSQAMTALAGVAALAMIVGLVVALSGTGWPMPTGDGSLTPVLAR